jgi:hypothetical protein
MVRAAADWIEIFTNQTLDLQGAGGARELAAV